MSHASVTNQESRRHHFVPKLLLRPWSVRSDTGQHNLVGYWWDPHRQELQTKRRGVDSFCSQLDLLTLKAHPQGRDAIERSFFGEIDSRGAVARDMLLAGQRALSAEERRDFARLLLSLEARRPVILGRLRGEGASYLASELDADPEVREAMAHGGIAEAPSIYVEQQSGLSLEDRALTAVQGLVDNPQVGSYLINARWDVRRLDPSSGSLILSDRPLIRIHAYNSPGAVWVLPLTPSAAFIAANHLANFDKLRRTTDQRLIKAINAQGAAQAERFAFSVDPGHAQWLGKYLRPIP